METRNSLRVSHKRRRSDKKNARGYKKDFNSSIKALLEKLESVLLDLEKKHGPIFLFALFAREEALFNRWDLLVAAPWLDSAKYESYKIVAPKVQNTLRKDITQLSHVEIIDADDPTITFLTDSYNVPKGASALDMQNCVAISDQFGFKIRRAFILRCTRDIAS